MKTSSKIFIGLLAAIFLFISAFILDIRVMGEHRSAKYTKPKTMEVSINDFKHLHINHFKSLKIAPSDKNTIQTVSYNSQKKLNFDYEIINDTLKIIGDAVEQGRIHTLLIKSELESITAKNSNVYLSGFEQNLIHLNFTNSKLNDYRTMEDPSHFNSAIIKLNLANLSFNNVKIDTIELQLEKSQATFRKEINSISAQLMENSKLNLQNIDDMKLQKDSSSKVRFY